MSVSGKFFAGLGRTLLSLIFLVTGVAQIFYWEQAESELAYALANWELHAGTARGVGDFLTALTSTVPIILIIAIVFQLVGGVFLFFHYRVRLAAFLLLIYLLWNTIVFQPFWYLEGHDMARSMLLFLKNTAIMGGLFIVLGLGKGPQKLHRVRVKRNLRRGDEVDEYDEE